MPIRPIPPRAGKTPYWYGRGSHLGRRVNRSTQARERRLALKIIHKWEREIERGEFAEPGEPTFAGAVATYIKSGGERRVLGPLLEHFKTTPLKRIDQAAIDAAADALYPSASSATRNRNVYTPMSAVLKRAGAQYDFRVRRPKGSAGRRLSEWLWPEQAFSLFEAADGLDAEFGLLLRVLTYTGCRLGEMLALNCDDLRVSEAFAFVRVSKNGDPQPVFLPPVLVAALANHPRGLERGKARVFRFAKSGHIYSLLRAAAAHAAVTLPDRQAFHILRHTYATWMRRYGGLDTAGLVGTQRWKDLKSADRYTHVVVGEEARRAASLPVETGPRGVNVDYATKRR